MPCFPNTGIYHFQTHELTERIQTKYVMIEKFNDEFLLSSFNEYQKIQKVTSPEKSY